MQRRLLTLLLAILLFAATACGPGSRLPADEARAELPALASAAPASSEMVAPVETNPSAPVAQEQIPLQPLPTPFPTEIPPPVELSPVDVAAQPSPTIVQPPTAPPTDLAIGPDDVFLHPVPIIYDGDKVTFQLLPHVPESIPVTTVSATILVNDVVVVSGNLERRNWNGQAEGVFEWAWDTTGLAGEHEIRVIIDPENAIQLGDENPNNNEVVLTTTVLAAGRQPTREAAAEWVTVNTGCCMVHVVSGTAAERDLDQLIGMLETAVQQASDRIGVQPNKLLQVYFIDRVLGQGGFAGSDMVVSYVDRRYAGGGLHELLVHEAVHVLDQQFAPQRVSILAEGLAVWASGGHYKAEDVVQRSAALLTLNEYVPLAQLANNFYPVQHEVGYLQAAGFVSYLIDRGGWLTFSEFYSNVTGGSAPSIAEALDQNLRTYYGIGLAEMENEWLNYLRGLDPSQETVDDLATTIRYYNVMRAYQQAYDPTAYFLTAWLPHPTAVREQGNPAALTRRPRTEENITLEVMLEAADSAVRSGDYRRANVLLDSVSRIVENGGVFIDPMSINYLEIVRAAAEYGYELHEVDLTGETARAMATQAPRNNLTSLQMLLRGQEWVILSH